MNTIDSCEYIWQAGVGFAQQSPQSATQDSNRTELLLLLLTCFSETIYLDRDESCRVQNKWVTFFTSPNNRHVLPLFTSLLNVVCAYDPADSFSLPYSYLMYLDYREPLVEVSLQILCVVLESTAGFPDSSSTPSITSGQHQSSTSHDVDDHTSSDVASCSTEATTTSTSTSSSHTTNLFLNYMSRIHRDEDFNFILSGITRLLNNPLTPTYLPGSVKRIQLHQELLVLFWRMCEVNKRFLYYVLKSSQVLDLLVPILYHLTESRLDPARLGLIHVGVFILLLLSGERNFGVRLNKPYKTKLPVDLASGANVTNPNHADLLILVFHKLIACGHKRIQPLFDCLLTIIVNVSPYLKTLSMFAANKLVHLLEAFSSTRFLFANQTNHQLVLLLLEVFNNLIQYQFDGNSNLVYTLIRKRQIFYHLANLSSKDQPATSLAQPVDHLEVEDEQEPGDNDGEHEGEGVPVGRSNGEASREDHTTMNGTAAESSTTTNKGDNKRYGPGQAVESNPAELKAPSSSNKSGTSTPMSPSQQQPSTTQSSSSYQSDGQDALPLFQTSLSQTPSVKSMTDRHLANSSRPSSSTADYSDALVSHYSPDRTLTPVPSSSSSNQTDDHHLHQGCRRTDMALPGTSLTHYQVSPSSTFASSSTNGTATSSTSTLTASSTSATVARRHESTTSSTVSTSSSSRRSNRRLSSSTSSTITSQRQFEWIDQLKCQLSFQTIMRLLQVLVPQVEKICIDKGLTEDSEIVKFLQNGTLVGLLPVPHPILIRKYQSNAGTAVWFRNYVWGVIYLRNVNPPIWYDTNVRLFEIQPIQPIQ